MSFIEHLVKFSSSKEILGNVKRHISQDFFLRFFFENTCLIEQKNSIKILFILKSTAMYNMVFLGIVSKMNCWVSKSTECPTTTNVGKPLKVKKVVSKEMLHLYSFCIAFLAPFKRFHIPNYVKKYRLR